MLLISKLLRLSKAVSLRHGTIEVVDHVHVRVNPNLAEAVEAGKYDCVNPPDFSVQFPASYNNLSGSYNTTIELLYFGGHEMGNDELHKQFSDNKFRVPSVEEFVAIGAHRPDLQERYPIVGLISNPRFDYNFGMGYPLLNKAFGVGKTGEDRIERTLELVHGIYKWHAECMFAAVRI